MIFQCKSCGLTQETRSVQCASKSGTIYNDSFCESSEKPELTRPCKSKPCDFQWFTSQWSNCSAECGKGVQSRRVICAQFEGTSVKAADDEKKCTEKKPEESKECEVKEECPGQWFSGPWSSCDKECGGGKKTRKVLCLANGTAISAAKCDEETIEFSSDDCNKQPCLEDETIPLDATSSPITEDDEGEDWCDDEDDESQETTDSLEVINTTDDVSSSTDSSASTDTSDDTDSTLSSDDDLMLSDSTDITCNILFVFFSYLIFSRLTELYF